MPTYEWVSDDGRQVLLEYAPMAEAPPVGATKDVDGVTFRRVPGTGARPTIKKSRRVEAFSLDAKGVMDPRLAKHVDAWGELGQACFDSQESVDRFVAESKRLAEAGETPEAFVYGEAPTGQDVQAAKKDGRKIRHEGWK